MFSAPEIIAAERTVSLTHHYRRLARDFKGLPATKLWVPVHGWREKRPPQKKNEHSTQPEAVLVVQ
jgi:hypothetical protein